MKRIVVSLLVIVFAASGAVALPADDSHLHIYADYNMPVGNNAITPNVAFGVGTTIWGIFELSAHAYTEILFGADNIFDIAGFRPIGLFSWGAGMRIPMRNFSLIMDWQSFYTGIGYSEVSTYCDSYKYGIAINLSEVFSLEFYSRTLFNFSETAIWSDLIDIESSEDRIQIIGAGAVLHLF